MRNHTLFIPVYFFVGDGWVGRSHFEFYRCSSFVFLIFKT